MPVLGTFVAFKGAKSGAETARLCTFEVDKSGCKNELASGSNPCLPISTN